MRKLAVLLFAALLLPLQACAAEEKWVEGKHYEVLDTPATASPQIIEFFSFWCPHCFRFEPIVAQIKEKIDGDTEFNKVHVNFMRFTSAEIQDDATRAMMIARAINQEEAMNKAVFNYIHQQRASITGLKDLRNIFLVNGVDAAEFDKLSSSFGVNSMLKKNNKVVDEYRDHLTGVPTFIINGRYKPTPSSDMTVDDIVELIVWLTKKK